MKTGWTVKPLAAVCQIKPPKAEARSLISANDLVSFVPMESLGIDQKILVPTQTRPLSEVAGSYTYFADGDVLLAKITPCFENGKLGIAANLVNGIGFGSSEYIVLRPDASLDKEWLYYFLARESFRNEGAERMTGAVGHKRVAKDFVEAYPIPLPPLPEQQRIVTLLDEAFDGIATARAHVEKNLQNARAIFESHLQSVFTQRGNGWIDKSFGEVADFRNGINFTQSSIGDPVKILGVKNFRSSYWAPLDNLETVTPDGALSDLDTLQSNDLVFVRSNGNPELIGRCLLIGQISEKATHSGFTIRARLRGPELSPTYLCHFLKSKRVRKEMVDGGNGANIRSLNQGTLSSLVIPMPSVNAQARIVAQLEALSEEIQRLESLYQRKLTALDDLKKSLLHQAFSGQLTSAKQTSVSLPAALQTTTPEFTANVISIAYARHVRQKREKTFGRVKEQKSLHLVESIGRLDLGRHPMKDAAGPNDFTHMLKAEEWAKAHGFFEMVKRDGGYDFKKLSAFDEHFSRARQALAPYLPQLESAIDLLVPMDKEEAEVFATVHAAWNNLLIDGLAVTDDAIVTAAREGWHADKLGIPKDKFRAAIALIRQKNLAPDGTAKYVGQPLLI